MSVVDNKKEVETVLKWGDEVLAQKRMLDYMVTRINDGKYDQRGYPVQQNYKFCNKCWCAGKLTVVKDADTGWLACEDCRIKTY